VQPGWASERAPGLRIAFRRKGRTGLKAKTRQNGTRVILLVIEIRRIAFSNALARRADPVVPSFVEKYRYP